MVTKLKKNKIVRTSLYFLLFISYCVYDAAAMIQESIKGDSNWVNTDVLLHQFQNMGYVKIAALFIFIAIAIVIGIFSVPFQTSKKLGFAALGMIALSGTFVIYKIHTFSYPIWYDQKIVYIIFRNIVCDTVLIVPSVLLCICLIKSVPYIMLSIARKKVETENEEKRIALEKMRQDLLASISHDLRTPLTSIISYIDILKKKELKGDAGDYVKIIDKKANVLRNMMDDIVYLSKLTSGNMQINLEKIDLKCFLDQVTFEWKAENEQLSDWIEYSVDGEAAVVECDGSKLYRVFQNLFDNILKYRKENTAIEIIYDNTDMQYVMIEIKNESSYPLQFQGDDMLERFVRADKARNSEGHGLGLAIANELVKLCNGKMKIEVQESYFIVKLFWKKLS